MLQNLLLRTHVVSPILSWPLSSQEAETEEFRAKHNIGFSEGANLSEGLEVHNVFEHSRVSWIFCLSLAPYEEIASCPCVLGLGLLPVAEHTHAPTLAQAKRAAESNKPGGTGVLVA